MRASPLRWLGVRPTDIATATLENAAIAQIEAYQGKAGRMIDVEVVRLRRLRRAALLTRALGRIIHSNLPDEAVFSRGALAAWGIARLLSGRLKSHPNLSYQQGPGSLECMADTVLAAVTGFVAAKQGRGHSVFGQQLQILARELDNVRALTWSSD